MSPDDLAPLFAARIAHLSPIIDMEAQWPAMRVRVRTYAGEHDCPDALITSTRAVVFRGRSVVVVRERDGPDHINPGGRREPGETIEATTRREVLEECGWHVGPLKLLGFHHLRPLGDKPAGHVYPWRDFIHLIHVAEAVRYDARARDRTQIEVGSRLTPISQALRTLPAQEVPLLRAAIAAR